VKIWVGHQSEHSMNLVMIGRFKEAATAEEVRDLIDKMRTAANSDPQEQGREEGRFGDRMLRVLSELDIRTLAPGEPEQFAYDYDVSLQGDMIQITTDELDVMGLIKVMVERGAKVELYSAHDYPDGEPSSVQE
jgi:Family of unknown function (DUF6375)